MNIKLILVLILLSYVVSHPKGDALRQLTKESESGIIVLNAQTFQEYVMTHPRPYDIVIFFSLKYKCKICEKIQESYEELAESFREKEGYKPEMKEKKRAVFFAVLYYSDSTSKIFKQLKLPSTISILYTTPHNIILDQENTPQIQYDEDFVIAFRDRNDNVHPHNLLEFVNAKSKRKFELRKNPLMFIFYFIVFISILVLGFYAFTTFKRVFLSPYLWLVGSFIIYIFCIGGLVYNLIHKTPFAKMDREGNIVEFIHSGQRAQYIGEGLMMSCLFIIMGTLMMSYNWINKIKGYWPHRILSLFILLLILIVVRLITLVYQKKAPWYNPTMQPPYNYIKGPLTSDQGISF